MIYKFCIITEKQTRVDIYLSALFWDFSRSYIQKIIDRWQVSVNWSKISKNLKLKNRDELVIEIITEKLEEILPEKMDLDIVFEDNEIVILNKEPWVNVHPVPWENWNKNTLVNWILHHCKENLPTIWWVERPGIVHRLDKDTSWLIMIAKSDKMMWYLSNTIKEREVDKYYLAVVTWKIKEVDFKIESYIWRDPNDRLKMTTRKPTNPKIAITHWKIIDYIDNKYTLVKIKLETWRTHQIRVHLASIWYPIIWDKVYWNSKVNKEVATMFQIHRQALHAYELKLNLYWEEKSFRWELKDDMKRIIWDLIK